jgi:hypothetical protein
LWEAITSLGLSLKLLSHAVRLLLKELSRRRFPHQISSDETTWRLLHGSHPPRQDAVLCQPALAELGRVYLHAGLLALG